MITRALLRSPAVASLGVSSHVAAAGRGRSCAVSFDESGEKRSVRAGVVSTSRYLILRGFLSPRLARFESNAEYYFLRAEVAYKEEFY
jgi:hypothetical protein